MEVFAGVDVVWKSAPAASSPSKLNQVGRSKCVSTHSFLPQWP